MGLRSVITAIQCVYHAGVFWNGAFFGHARALYLAGISILAYVFTKISVYLYAAAIVLERVVGWSPLTAAVILGISNQAFTPSRDNLRPVVSFESGSDP